MSSTTEVLAVAAITVLAVVSPGPDFAMVVRNSYRHGRRAGLLGALGIALGVQVHVFYTMFGVTLLMQHAHGLLYVVKLLGAAYLVWIGIQTWRRPPPAGPVRQEPEALPARAALRMGFLTNALNPKTTLFVVSTYTQVVDAQTPLPAQFGYGLFMSAAHLAWFSLVACCFAAPALRVALLRHARLLDRCIGSALVSLGLALGFSKLA
ncbi:lysine transporter LysE [Cupriavidus sp. USMAA2-4]|uniref:Lysine transporter LysE n=1 Tax=Cupriavidus malaysiensis TaxID=367825 RepID=A0ABN4TSR6_9BURK|nr:MULTISPECIES: LysE family transporter [Cupriavidus]AOY95207.1 lysine transporter LysE [Cupriavidus sp. USMAA2-4]AOZ01894.1 lysine transporter LysE [Cupriavidus sp. USMAHM13]AOZ08370.1 lysine transporter LysE [Cupriavidus malaysiensis]